MPAIFCPTCGSKSDYQFSMPNFCSKCGNSYIEKRQNPILPKTTSASKVEPPDDRDDDWDDDGEDYDSDNFSNASRVPRISRIDVDIDVDTGIRSFKFGDILNSNVNSTFKKSRNLNLDDLVDE
jgi:hypothetical protein